MAEKKEFLNPKSMITPGAAGSMTTVIALALSTQFDLSFKWVALGMSFLIGFLVICQYKEQMKGMEKGLYCLVNSFFIFAMSVGGGALIDNPASPPPEPPSAVDKLLSAADMPSPDGVRSDTWFAVSSAYAEDGDAPGRTDPTVLPPEKVEQLERRLEEERRSPDPELSPEEMEQVERYIEQQKKYRRWSW